MIGLPVLLVTPQAQQVFFIGNSNVYWATPWVEQFAAAAGVSDFAADDCREATGTRCDPREFVSYPTQARVMNTIASGTYSIVALSTQTQDFIQYPYEQIEEAGVAMLEAVIAAGSEPYLIFDYNTNVDDQTIGFEKAQSLYFRIHAALEHAVVRNTTHTVPVIPVLQLYQKGKLAYPNWMKDAVHGGDFAQYCSGALFFKFLTDSNPNFEAVQGSFSDLDRAWCRDTVETLYQQFAESN